MANVIAQLNKPTLVLAHNKTLVAQLYGEFKEFFLRTQWNTLSLSREYYGRSATTIENKCKIEYGTEQGLAALIYGEKGLSSLPIQDIAGEHIDTDNEYMYYYSVEFIK